MSRHFNVVKRSSGHVRADSVTNSKKAKPGLVSNESAAAFRHKLQVKREKCANSIAEFAFNKLRVKLLSTSNDIHESSKGIVYWMSRDQRVQDNWAFLYAQYLALKCREPLHVCFCLVPSFLNATLRHYDFMLRGLKEVEAECRCLNISFHLLQGQAPDVLPDFVQKYEIGAVVTDFSPLRISLEWVQNVNENLPDHVTFCQVDAHNIVPCWEASKKLEYAARTIRGKINCKLQDFLTEFPPLIKHPFSPVIKSEQIDWDSVNDSLQVNDSVLPVSWAVPGTVAGLMTLDRFCETNLVKYSDFRNDPNEDCIRQVAAQRCCLEVKTYRTKHSKSVDAFLEEIIIRRELADNFCYYNADYDRIEGGKEWARNTLDDHRHDERQYIYSKKVLEEGKTHDRLWNAAQLQMVNEGKMHGFLRMYWAKKILEWTKGPEEALEITIYLNDRYELDGRDPNGYVGCMWSIVGIHDQGWAERKIFGKIRYMNFKGCQRKFDVEKFIRRYVAES